MITVVLWDVDGVILKPRKQYFSDRLLALGHAVDIDSVKEFFKEVYPDIAVGKRDLSEAVEPYMRKWGWELSTNELLEYWFEGENEMNDEVVELIGSLRKKGVLCFAISDHSRYRADDLMKKRGLGEWLDGGWFSGHVGYTKEEKEFWETVFADLQKQPEEILVVDDDVRNVRMAGSVGITGVYFEQDVETLRKRLTC